MVFCVLRPWFCKPQHWHLGTEWPWDYLGHKTRPWLASGSSHWSRPWAHSWLWRWDCRARDSSVAVWRWRPSSWLELCDGPSWERILPHFSAKKWNKFTVWILHVYPAKYLHCMTVTILPEWKRVLLQFEFSKNEDMDEISISSNAASLITFLR